MVDTPTSIWRETFETNLFGAVRMCREVVPLMRKLRYGRIVNMSSGLGQLQTRWARAVPPTASPRRR